MVGPSSVMPIEGVHLETPQPDNSIRYEPNERPPTPVALGVALQIAVVAVAPVVVNTAVIVRAAGQADSYLSWTIFGALVVCGITTVLQTVRIGRLGAGHILIMSTSPVFAAVCITALVKGGPAMLSSLIVVSSLLQFALVPHLSLLRRIITPVISGTVIMLIAASIMPIVFGLLEDAPDATSSAAVLGTSAVTLIVVVALALRGSSAWQPWSPLIGILAGCVTATLFGLYDGRVVTAASWVGIPPLAWPGLDLTPGVEFWVLLPTFLLVTLISAVKTVAAGVAVQQVSWRIPRATDFRIVQRALNTEAVGRVLSGLIGTMPNTPDPSGVSIVATTGIAARSAGVYVGATFVVLAFSPKVTALIMSIPSPVIVAYMIFLLGLVFVGGIRMIIQDNIDRHTATIVGVAFWIGAGFEHHWISSDRLDRIWSSLLSNGIISGGLAAILMSEFVELTGPRRRRLDTELRISALPDIDRFLCKVASKLDLEGEATNRLRSSGEEILLSLIQQDDRSLADSVRRLIIFARAQNGTVDLEFIAASDRENLEDHLTYMNDIGEPDEQEVSFRLLKHHASSVRHQKYHGIDIVHVRIEI